MHVWQLIANACLFFGLVSAQSASASASQAANVTVRPLGTRAHHGLKSDGMQINSIYFGVLPDWSKESPIDVNRALGKSIAIIGDYIYVSADSRQDDPFIQMKWHSSDVLRLKDFSVYAPAVILNFPLTQWTQAMSIKLAEDCAWFNQRGVPVWLRFAYEMNGSWMQYGLDPQTYVSVWRSLTDTVRANPQANSTYMVWSPNVASGPTDGLLGYTQYYPGQDYVDIAGLSFYFSGDDSKTQNMLPANNEFQRGFQRFYDLYGSVHPVVISETSAARHYQIPSSYQQRGPDTEIEDLPALSSLTTVPASGGPSEVGMKSSWMQQMTGPQAAGRYPNLTSVSFFNYMKESNQSQFLDFRAVGGDPETESWFRQYVGNVSAYQGGFDGAASKPANSAFLWAIFVSLLAFSIL